MSSPNEPNNTNGTHEDASNPVDPNLQQAVRYLREMVAKYGTDEHFFSDKLKELGINHVEVVLNDDNTLNARWSLQRPICVPYRYEGEPTAGAAAGSLQWILIFQSGGQLSDRPLPGVNLEKGVASVHGVRLMGDYRGRTIITLSSFEDDMVPRGYAESEVQEAIAAAITRLSPDAEPPLYDEDTALEEGCRYCDAHMGDIVAEMISAWAMAEGYSDDTYGKFKERESHSSEHDQ
ncbi:MAG TPA: hypothetical protein VN778_03130 [Verrucomicrobiae bacterium]|nr:hypothetical protein [Verrucomicrobiae bacterium]